MCGISGEIRFDGKDTDIAAVAAVTRHMHRRGEDGEGIVSFGSKAFGHRRLKIFDLSEKAQQPMFDQKLGLAITFNGAIYNYLVLRRELQEKGYQFFSASDTEVLLKAYHCWGLDMLAKINGMFVFAIWERESGKTVLVRDRMGIKPLYYTHKPGYLRFASALPALLTCETDKIVDDEALHYYLMFHVVPEPLSLIKGINKLEPGTAMVIDADGRSRKHRYWKLDFLSAGENSVLTENEWLEQLEITLIDAVKCRLLADVPIGILLSGGLDSSLIVALIAETTNKAPSTFSIGFESTPEEAGDEFSYSDIIARRFSTDHHKIFVETPKMHKSLIGCIKAMSEPMPSHDNVGFYILSKEVKKHVTVVQSGQGADELFAGYHWFQNMDRKVVSYDKAAAELCDRIADNSYDDYLGIVSPERRTPNHALSYMERLCGENESRSMVDHLQQYESTCALTNGPVARVDNMTMAWGLEARVPFLDYHVAELACRMPARLKTRKGGKYLLKKLARKFLPEEIIDRPKGYFPVPRLKNPGVEEINWLKEILSPANIKKRALFNHSYIEKLFKSSRSGSTNLGASRLWQIGVLECWLQANRIS